MLIEFIFTGKTSEKWIEEACTHFLNRINRYAKAEIKVVNSSTSQSTTVQKKKEAEKILEKKGPKDFIILLDELGKQFTSDQFAGEVEKFINSGKAKVIFIIGGPFGSDNTLMKRADIVLSFSKMTFTHQMIRPILLEQVYRAFTILKNEKYHH